MLCTRSTFTSAPDVISHGRPNLFSSYGFVEYNPHQTGRPEPHETWATSSTRKFSTWLSAFEHCSAKWRGLPNPPSVHGATASSMISITSGSDGLMLCLNMSADYGTGRIVGVWNSLLRPFRWLQPTTHLSLTIGSPNEILAMFVMVAEKASAYRVLVLIGRQRGSVAKEGPGRRYIVYNSQYQEWSLHPRDLPDSGSIFYYSMGRSTFVSAAQFVFFLGVESTAGSLDHFIWCYAAKQDVWHRFRISKLLKDIGYPRLPEGYSSGGGYLLSLVALPGKLYAAVMRIGEVLSVEDGEIDSKIVMSSLDLSSIGEYGGESRFQFVRHPCTLRVSASQK